VCVFGVCVCGFMWDCVISCVCDLRVCGVSAQLSSSRDRYESTRLAVYQFTDLIYPLNGLHEHLNCWGIRDAPSCFSKDRRVPLRGLMAIIHSFSHICRSLKYGSRYLTSSSW